MNSNNRKYLLLLSLLIINCSLVASEDCIVVYSECNYSGLQQEICQDQPVMQAAFQIKSLKVPEGQSISFYDSTYYRGTEQKFATDQSCLENPIKTFEETLPEEYKAYIFTKGNYFVSAVNGGGSKTSVDKLVADSWERFTFTPTDNNGGVCIRTSDKVHFVGPSADGFAVSKSRKCVRAELVLVSKEAQTFAIKFGDYFLSAHNNGGSILTIDKTEVTDAETFYILKFPQKANLKVNFKAANLQFVCAESGGNDVLNANRNAAQGWELFSLERTDNGQFCLGATDAHFVGVEGDTAKATFSTCQPFTLLLAGFDGQNFKVALRFGDKYLSAVNGGGEVCKINAKTVKNNEIFTLLFNEI